MNRFKSTISLLAILIFFGNSAFGQLSITTPATPFIIDFDNTVTGVNQGQFQANGFVPTSTPLSAGQLNSDAFTVNGVDGGTMNFGDVQTAGGYAGGASNGGSIVEGIHAYQVSVNNYAIGVKPGSTNLNPGDIRLRIVNNSGVNANFIQIIYDVLEFQQSDNSTYCNLAYSFDDVNYTNISALDYHTATPSELMFVWISEQRSYILDLSASPIPDGGSLYLRWNVGDYSYEALFDPRSEVAIDNISLLINPTPGNDQTSEILASPTIIPSNIIGSWRDTEPEAQTIYRFIVEDKGGDGLPTNIQNIRFYEGPGTNIVLSDNIQGFRLRQGSAYKTISALNFGANYVDLQFNEGVIVVPEGSTITFSLFAYLNTNALIDNGAFDLVIPIDGEGSTTYSSGSGFNTVFPAQLTTSIFTIDVLATQLTFSQMPSDPFAGCLNEIFTPNAELSATDSNGNIDLDFNSTITISNTGALTMSGNSVSATNGVATFPSLYFTQTGGPVTLNASGGSLVGSDATNITISFDDVSGLAASSGENTTSTLSWTNPATCVDEVLIVASTASITAIPSGDGTTYVGNASYGLGTEISVGEFVVYKGTGNNSTITGLSNGVPYFFKAFVRNGTNWTAGIQVTATPSGVVTGIVNWNFENQNRIANLDVNGGSSLTDNSGGQEAYETGNAPSPLYALRMTNWGVGEYFEFAFNSLGYENLRLSLHHYRTAQGPVDFELQFSTDGVSFTTLPGSARTNPLSFNADSTVFNLTGLSVNNTLTAYIRLVVTNAGSNGGHWVIDNVNISGTPVVPSDLNISIVNMDVLPVYNQPFNVTIQAEDNVGNPVNVVSNTDVLLNLQAGTGNLTGTLTGTILAGTSTVQISGINYDMAETGVQLGVSRTSGDNLNAGTSQIFTVLTSEPANQVTSLTIDNPGITETSIPLIWTRDAIPGDNVIIVARQGAAVDMAPADGQSYTASADFGTGSDLGNNNYVVYIGNAETAVTVTSLTPSNTYYFAAYEFNGTGGVENYLLTGAPTAFAATCFAPTTQVSNIQFPAIGDDQLDISWINGDGTSRYVVINTINSFTDPVDGIDPPAANAVWQNAGEQVIYNGNGSTASVSGLDAATTYFIRIYEYACTGADVKYNTTDNAVSVLTRLFYEDFTTCPAPGWVIRNISGASWTCDPAGYGSVTGIGAASATETWYISPAIDFSTLSNELLTFQTYTEGTDVGYPQLTLAYSTDYTGSGNPNAYTWTSLPYNPSVENSSQWTSSGAVDLSAIASSAYIGFKYIASGTVAGQATTWRIDDIAITDQPCAAPLTQASDIIFTNIQATTATISWTNGDGLGRIVAIRENNPTADPVSGTAYLADANFGSGDNLGQNTYVVYSGTGNSVNVIGLAAGSSYEVKVYEYGCSTTSPEYIITDGTNNPSTLNTLDNTLSSIIEEPTFVYPQNIDYLSYITDDITDANSIEIAQFTIADNGNDNAGTTLTDLRLVVSNHINLQKIALYDGINELAEVASSDTAVFTELTLNCAKGSTRTFSVRVSFNTAVIDNDQISLNIDTVKADPIGTAFNSFNAGGAVTTLSGDENRIEVTATALAFNNVPTNVQVNADFTVTVDAVDINNNIDLDAVNAVTMALGSSGSGVLSSVTGLTQNLNAGQLSYTDLQYNTVEVFNVAATTAGLTITGDSPDITAENLLVLYTFTGAAGNELTFAPDYQPALLTVSDINRGTDLTPTTAADAFNSSNWPASRSDNYYYEFTVTPNGLNSMDLYTFMFEGRRSATGPETWWVFSSLDGFTSSLGNFSYSDDLVHADNTVVLSGFSGLTTPVTIRIYGSGASNPAGTFRVDNIRILGNETDLTPPAFIAGYPVVTDSTTTGFTLLTSADDLGMAYYIAVADGEQVPTKEQVRDGVNYDAVAVLANGSIGIITVDSVHQLNISGLVASSHYDIYVVLEDAGLNLSDPSLIDVMTTNDDSDVGEPVAQVAAGSISSLQDTQAESIEVFRFNINDNDNGLDNDVQPTNVTKITIQPGALNTAAWSTQIGGAVIATSGGPIATSNVSIYNDSIVFTLDSGDLVINDNTSEEIRVAIWLQNSGIIDNEVMQFRINSLEPKFESTASRSNFATTFTADVSSNTFDIVVEATELLFTSVPASSPINTDFSIVVAATDMNGNTDIDNNSSVTLTKYLGEPGGILSAITGLTQSLVGGVYAWSDVQYDVDDYLSLRISDDASIMAADTSSLITIGGGLTDLIVSSSMTLNTSLDVPGNVIILNTGILTLNSGVVLRIGGDFTNDGVFNDNADSVVFNGTTADQTISGTTSPIRFYNLRVNNGTGGFTLLNETNIIIENLVKLSANATIDADGAAGNRQFILESTASNTARIDQIEAGGTFLGNVTMQRYIGTGPAGWRFMGAPLKGQTIGSWADDFGVQGVAERGPTYWTNVAYYEEALGTNGEAGLDGWIDYTSFTNPLVVGRGSKAYIYASAFSAGALTVDYTGEPVIGDGADNTMSPAEADINIPVTFNASAFEGGGWNLVANPYPSEINWESNKSGGINLTNVNDELHVWNPQLAQYGAYISGTGGTNGVTQYVASGQAFWVRANASSPSVTMNEGAKANDQGATFLREAAPQNLLRIHLATDKGYKDEAIVHFREDATRGVDVHFDAHKIEGGWINISTLVNDTSKLAINSMGALRGSMKIPVSLKPFYFGQHSLSFSDLGSFEPNTRIYLKDNYLDQKVEINTATVYAFEISDQDESTYKDRFELIMASPVDLSMPSLAVMKDEQVNVPVSVERFDGIVGSSFEITWNPALLAFDEIGNLGLPGMTSNNIDASQAAQGKLKVTWNGAALVDQGASMELLSMKMRVIARVDEVPISISLTNSQAFHTSDLDVGVNISEGGLLVKKSVVSGQIASATNAPLSGKKVTFTGDETYEVNTDTYGTYAMNVYDNGTYAINIDNSNGNFGITTLDIIKTRRHILNKALFNSPYDIIAADANKSKTLTALDLVWMQRSVLGLNESPIEFVLVSADENLSGNPLAYGDVQVSLSGDAMMQNVKVIKPGDVDHTWSILGARMDIGRVDLLTIGAPIVQNSELKIPVLAKNFNDISGMQFELKWSEEMHFIDMEPVAINPMLNKESTDLNKLKLIWDNESGASTTLSDGTVMFYLVYSNNEVDVELPEIIQDDFPALAYNGELETMQIGGIGTDNNLAENGYELYQNIPNPFTTSTQLKFRIPSKQRVTLTIVNVVGEVVYKVDSEFVGGVHQIDWKPDSKINNARGVYIMTMQAGQFTDVRKLIYK